MPIHYYTWTTNLDGESISFRILESSDDDARQQIIQNIEKFQEFREKYEHYNRQLCINKQNRVFIEKKALDAYAADDQSGVESLERALQMVHDFSRRLRQEKHSFLDNLPIDTRGMIEEVSPFSVHLDAIVRGETGEEMTLRQFLGSAPTVTAVNKIEFFHNT